jgi:hypothetical protein
MQPDGFKSEHSKIKQAVGTLFGPESRGSKLQAYRRGSQLKFKKTGAKCCIAYNLYEIK